ncbi:MAG: penicillin-binding protein 1C, partial [Chitinophagaceae bacterium]
RDIGKKGDQLGLSMILGGCGVTLEEMTLLYSAFANKGQYVPAKWLQDEPVMESKQLISPAATFMINEILTQLLRPDLPHNAYSSTHLPKIAWKTGTSYGRRDAWSIGYNKKYTVGVWVGNFSGEGVPELNGTDSATPLLFDIFNSIDYNSTAGWFTAPPNMALRRVCTETGLPVNSFCESQAMDYYLPGISAVAKCRHLKQVPVSEDEKFAYCTTCQPESGYVQKWYPNFAPEILTFYDANQLPYTHIPAHNPGCSRIFSDNAPVIVSPAAEMEYLLEAGEKQKLMLHANAHNEVKKLFWYVNDKLLKTAPATENIFFEPTTAGRYKISCTDDQGRNTNSYVMVSFL